MDLKKNLKDLDRWLMVEIDEVYVKQTRSKILADICFNLYVIFLIIVLAYLLGLLSGITMSVETLYKFIKTLNISEVVIR